MLTFSKLSCHTAKWTHFSDLMLPTGALERHLLSNISKRTTVKSVSVCSQKIAVYKQKNLKKVILLELTTTNKHLVHRTECLSSKWVQNIAIKIIIYTKWYLLQSQVYSLQTEKSKSKSDKIQIHCLINYWIGNMIFVKWSDSIERCNTITTITTITTTSTCSNASLKKQNSKRC